MQNVALIIFVILWPSRSIALAKSTIPSGSNELRVELGTGYKSATGQFTTMPCVTNGTTGRTIAIANPDANFAGGFAESRSEIEDKFSLSAEATANVGLLSVEGKADVSTALAESDLKTSSYVTFTYTAGNVLLLEPDISSFGRGVMSPTDSSGTQRLYTACGDEYVYQVQLGARIHAGFEFTFHNKAIKNRAQVKLRVSDVFGIIDIGVGVSAHLDFDDVLASVNLVFFQEGGGLSAAERIKSGIPKDCYLVGKRASDGKSYLSGHERCLSYYNHTILPYARNEFAQQVSTRDYRPGIPGVTPGINVLYYFTKRYDESAWPELQTNSELPREVANLIDFKLKPFFQLHQCLTSLERTFANILENANPEYQGLVSVPGPANGAPIEISQVRQLHLDLQRILDTSKRELARCQSYINARFDGAGGPNDLDACRSSASATIDTMRHYSYFPRRCHY